MDLQPVTMAIIALTLQQGSERDGGTGRGWRRLRENARRHASGTQAIIHVMTTMVPSAEHLEELG